MVESENTNREVLMIRLRWRFTSSREQIPSLRKYNTKPKATRPALRVSKSGRNHHMPLVPQYRSLERAAALETLARPKRTSTTLGKQHMEARKAEPPIHFHNDLTSLETWAFSMVRKKRVSFSRCVQTQSWKEGTSPMAFVCHRSGRTGVPSDHSPMPVNMVSSVMYW